MTAPAYTSDVTSNELSTAETTTGWTNYGTGAVADETDYAIQGTHCVSKGGWTAAVRGMLYNAGSDKASVFASNKAFLAWVEYHNPNLLAAYASGGLALVIGNTASAFYEWYVGGSDTIPYAGWHCFAVDPKVDTNGDTAVGSPSSVLQYFGVVANVGGSGTLKGNPLGIDVIRIGREMYAEYGEAANYATLAGAEAYANDVSRRWGLLMLREGAYYMQGCFVMGTAAHAVDFRDSDRSILILDTPKCHASFNGIEIRNASSRVDWTRYTVKAMGTTSKGYFTVVNDADVNFDSCSFIDMGAFSLLAATGFVNCVLIRCGVITAAGATMTGTQVNAPTVAADTAALVWNVNLDPNGRLDGMSFVRGANAHHAIEFGTTAPTTVTLTGQHYTGFGANGATDAVLLLDDRGSNVTWTINYPGGDVPTYKKMRSGDTVNVVSTVNVTLTGLVNPTECRVYTRDGGGNSDTEISGTEDVTTGSFAFSGSAGTHVNVVIYSLGYLPVYLTDYVIPSSTASIPISQVFDRQYENP